MILMKFFILIYVDVSEKVKRDREFYVVILLWLKI